MQLLSNGQSARKKVLDHGYVDLVCAYESDEAVIESARMSTGKGFLGWEAGTCPICDGMGMDDTGTGCFACEGNGRIAGDAKLLARLWKLKHATPFEMAGAIFESQAPIFIYREWHRHRTQSYAELSARYAPLPDVNYVPSIQRLLVGADKSNKQAGTIKGAAVLTEADAIEYRASLIRNYELDQQLYEHALQMGVPKELARIHLPVGRYSRMRAHANLRNWLGFLALRMAPGAQWEIQEYARAIHFILTDKFPRTLALFDESMEA